MCVCVCTFGYLVLVTLDHHKFKKNYILIYKTFLYIHKLSQFYSLGVFI